MKRVIVYFYFIPICQYNNNIFCCIQVKRVGQMCSSHLDLISMLEKMPGFENMNYAIKLLNIEKLGLNQNKTQNYATLKRGEGGLKAKAALDPEKMFREVRRNLCKTIDTKSLPRCKTFENRNVENNVLFFILR